MPIRYVGRESYFRGKTLFEIAANLRNCGEGRVVTRFKFAERYEEKSYYRLTKVTPDLSDKTTRSGKAWGVKVFRGENLGVRQIDAGMKADWRLIPREEESTYCQELSQPRPRNVVPKYADIPPLLGLLAKQEMSARGEDTSQPLRMELNIKKDFLNRAIQEDT
ncbi:28S ribosomal protein S34, mitochondrial-like [Haliotis rufescens]|uniref:28S ribosomal protein S34, mitochondrial-like n=1 Tax=Haliotis rufescens TaxID=6454 RepID=UPI001EB05918|nr:28S ribosomal protein S34, mitochondrial-like [Haliotis rufescens]